MKRSPRHVARRRTPLMAVLLLLASLGAASEALAYRRAVEDPENVKNKLFPKKGKVELGGKFGMVLNSSYVNTFLVNGSLSYFFSEEWGFQVEGNLGLTSDKGERECIEYFFNDPEFNIDAECGPREVLEEQKADSGDTRANFGPAYVPIREIKYIFGGNILWNPLYGKQIILLSGVGHFDLFIGMGGGMAVSDYYDLQTNLKGTDRPSRGVFSEDGSTPDPGAAEDEEDLYGKAGRPDPRSETNVVAHFSVGQRFHFAKRFMLTAELKNYTLLGTPSGFDNFFTLMGGFGVRF